MSNYSITRLGVILFTILFLLLHLASCRAKLAPTIAAKETPATIKLRFTEPDTTESYIQADQFTSLDLHDYENFKKQIKPLLDEMASKKVVSLGEGTHGSREFYKARFWITRLLVEEYGFDKIAFETDYADAYLLNEALQGGNQEHKQLMKTYLLSIWQNKEVEELLKWIQARNTANTDKIDLLGIDHPFVLYDARMIQELTAMGAHKATATMAKSFERLAIYQDSIWNNTNKEGFTYNAKEWFRNGVKAYQLLDSIEGAVPALNLAAKDKDKLEGVLLNAKLAYDAFYQYDRFKRESSRDSCMAEMASWIVRGEGDKLIIWAHNIHAGKQEVTMSGYPVGGMGAYISRKFPDGYYVLGMGTAGGSFAATTDRVITKQSPMASYTLQPATAGSLEGELEQVPAAAFYLTAATLAKLPEKLPHWAVGFGTDSGKDSYVRASVAKLYDAFIFIKETNAATPLAGTDSLLVNKP
ncbi:erythromycin esterase family protein [Pontibacter actiniarum]|uniref:Erythromycin esterase n=1 Tax=Pontibacter actiniarum TaxID=323450 RepID=A0A1X9YQR5_9BACT|nr:erythromycin esterase family protein [Pontibacter actiniarum]ARS35191.1 hypothetical protein CA264_06905 [Pontibacter actiniarum]